MLEEIKDVKQYEAGKHRRWFHSQYFDLYTWEQTNGVLEGFQLCYAKDSDQRALRWSEASGYRHEGVDSPEDKPGRAMSAIFVADGAFDHDAIAGKFAADAERIAPAITTFVLTKIRAYDPGESFTDSDLVQPAQS